MLKKLNKIRKEVVPSLIPAVLPSLSTFAVINASVFSGYIAAQNATIEEVVVTARKKSESLQDVPLSVSALNEETLEERGINVFEDYLMQLRVLQPVVQVLVKVLFTSEVLPLRRQI